LAALTTLLAALSWFLLPALLPTFAALLTSLAWFC
jgi:hypothetical protein